MHDIGAIIWAIVVIFGVISSIVRAQRANARRQTAAPPVAPSATLAPPPRPQVIPQASAIIAPPPPPLRRPVVQKPDVIVADAVPSVRTASPIRGMFGSRPALVRAMVAAQVLSPPRALQEHSIWSPQNSEPST